MHRLQISLTETQYEFLKSEAFIAGKSMAFVLRDLLDETMAARRQSVLENDPIWGVIGIGENIDGPTDVSSNVDKYLYGTPLEATNSTPLQKVAEEPDEYTAD